MASEDVRVDVLSVRESLLALRSEWNDLFKRSGCTQLSLSFDWIWCAWTTMIEPNRGELCIIVVRRGERLALIWPLVRQRQKRFWTAIMALGVPEAYDDLLIETSENQERLARLAWGELSKLKRADLLLLNHMRRDSGLAQLMHLTGCKVVTSQRAPLIDRESFADWDLYWKSIDRNFRRNVDRRQRRLEEAGASSFEVVTDRDRLQEVVRWLLTCKREWVLRRRLAHSCVMSPDYESFLQHAITEVNTFGHFVGFTVTLDRQLIAAQLVTICGPMMCSLHIAYDESYAKFSPGHVLHKYSLQWAFERDFCCDFRFGTDEHKRILGNRSVDVVTLLSCRTPWGHVYDHLRTGSNLPVVRSVRKALVRPMRGLLPSEV